MNDQGFNGERDLRITRQTAAVIVGSFIGLFILSFFLGA